MTGDDDDKKVKDLLDAATRAELERWFGLPSFEQLADRGAVPRPPPEPEDPELVEVRRKRAEAIAAVDPAIIESHRRRIEPSRSLVSFKEVVVLRADPGIARLDLAMIGRLGAIAEPREVEIAEPLRDDLRDCTPQALLRDLHRPETEFPKVFEIVDAAATQRLDASAAVASAMATRWTLDLPPLSPMQQAYAFSTELRDERRRPWIEITMPLRRVTG
jgi:hypothetical protein